MADILAFNALKNGRLPPIFYFGKHFLDSLIMKNMTLEEVTYHCI
jgi:hypothetical protein